MLCIHKKASLHSVSLALRFFEVMVETCAESLLVDLAEWASSRFDVDGTLGDAARLSFIDTAACVVAGATTSQGRRVSAASRRLQSAGSALQTALHVGATAHALDFDDYELCGSTHPSAPLIGAILALADPGTHTLGDLLDGYVVGYQTIIELGNHLGYSHYEIGWHATSTIGTVGAAMAAGYLIGLRGARLAHAAALATSMSSGLKAQFGTDAKALHAGFAARAGVEAAALAEQGLLANPAVFEAPSGMLDLFGGPSSPGQPFGRPDRRALVTDPPLRKAWPCCSYAHRAIDAALTASQDVGDRLAQIRSVELTMAEPFFRVASFRRPSDPSQARFSTTFCVASALADGAVTPSTFSPAQLERADIRALEALIDVKLYDAADMVTDLCPQHPDHLRVHLHDGPSVDVTVADVPGGPSRPMPAEDIIAKYVACGGDQDTARRALDTKDSAGCNAIIDCFTATTSDHSQNGKQSNQ